MAAAVLPNALEKSTGACDVPNEKPEAEIAPGAALPAGAAEAAAAAVPGLGVSHDLQMVAEASFMTMHVSHSHCPAFLTASAANVLGAGVSEKEEAADGGGLALKAPAALTLSS